jgi:uncharacterized protein YqeY
MTIKERIDADYITAYKAKDITAKTALSSIKAAITIAFKSNGTWVATDDEIIKIINKGIKQREESIKMYETAGRQELVDKERDEMEVLKKYMPAQMSYDEISNELIIILQEIAQTVKNPQALVGKTIGEFNKRHQGKADVGTVKEILAKLVEV